MSETIQKIDIESVKSAVQDGLCAQFDGIYSWSNMIDDLDLSPEEKAWAKEHTIHRVEITGINECDNCGKEADDLHNYFVQREEEWCTRCFDTDGDGEDEVSAE